MVIVNLSSPAEKQVFTKADVAFLWISHKELFIEAIVGQI